jgi:hypothetical protein
MMVSRVVAVSMRMQEVWEAVFDDQSLSEESLENEVSVMPL